MATQYDKMDSWLFRGKVDDYSKLSNRKNLEILLRLALEMGLETDVTRRTDILSSGTYEFLKERQVLMGTILEGLRKSNEF